MADRAACVRALLQSLKLAPLNIIDMSVTLEVFHARNWSNEPAM